MADNKLQEYQLLLAQQERDWGINPDNAAKAHNTAKKLGVPVEAVQDSPENAYIKAAFKKVWDDTEGLGTLRKKMTESNFHGLASDDTESLSKTEKASIGYGEMRQGADDPWYLDLYRSIRRGFYQGKASVGLVLGGFDVLGLDAGREKAAKAAGVNYDRNIDRSIQYRNDMRQAARFAEDSELQKSKQGLEQVNRSGRFGDAVKYLFNNPALVLNTTTESLGRASPQLAMSAAVGGGGPLGVALTAGGGSFINEYAATIAEVMEDKGAELEGMSESQKFAYVLSRSDWMGQARKKAFKRGIAISAFDAMTAGVAGRLIGGAKGGLISPIARTAGEGGVQAGGGMAGEAVAQLVTDEWKPADILLEGFAEVPTGAFEARANYREARARAGELRAQQAKTNAEHMQEQSRNAQESKLSKRAPDVAAEFIDDTYEESSRKIYIDGEALMQSGIAEKVAEAIPDIADDIHDAVETGGMVEMTRGRFHAELPSEVQAELIGFVRENPESMNANEAEQWQESGQDQDFEEAFNQGIAEAEKESYAEASRNAIQENIYNQLIDTGRFTEDQAKQNAALAAAGYQAQAQRYGLSAEQLFQQMPLNVVGESIIDDGVYSQALASNPPKGWKHSENPEDAINIWTENGKDAAKNEAVFWTLDNAVDTGLPNTLGYSHSVSRSAAHHIYKEHGNAETEAKRGQIAVTAQDLVRIPDIVSSPDQVITGFQSGQGADRVAYLKKFDDALVVYIAEASRKKKDFRAISMRKYPPTATSENVINNISSQSLNVQNGEGAYSNNTIEKTDVQDFLYQSSKTSDSFEKTSEIYGGKAAYEAAKESGDTELTYHQWVQVRTPEFKKWFGDWENDPNNSSKVINSKTGEPLIVYHGTQGDFTIFEHGHEGYDDSPSDGYFFTDNKEAAEEYGDYGNVIPAFINIKNMFSFDRTEDVQMLNDSIEEGEVSSPLYGEEPPLFEAGENVWDKIVDTKHRLAHNDVLNGILNYIESESYDGVLMRDSMRDIEEYNSYVIFSANQIKSATDNNGEFNPENDSILYQQEDSHRGFFNPRNNTIAVLKNADASTFAHELGHFFLEMQTNIAFSLAEKAEKTNAEQIVIDDMNTLLDWFGVKDLDTWVSMSTEEQREYHEQFARGFEAYLYEGKTPSESLRGVFSRFRDWLKQVYESLTSLDVELTDDVRAVYGRMLATDEAIAETEQLNGMHPLFESAEQMGVDDQSFASYLNDKKMAELEAQEYLQGKVLRDMAFVRNARAGKIRELRKHHKRDFERAEEAARHSIMEQPVYRAWQFLTGPINNDNKIKNADKTKFDKHVDPSRDSLFKAIAKLGGLNKDELVAEWGLDRKDAIKSPVFSMPILRRTNGKTIDQMVEALAQEGYLPLDNTGKADTRDLEERFFDEMRGNIRYSSAYVPQQHFKAGYHAVNTFALSAARFDNQSLNDMNLPENIIETLKNRGMVSNSGGLHPDIIADLIQDSDGVPFYVSGSELVQALYGAQPPQEAIEQTAYLNVLSEKGEVPDAQAFENAADMAVHNKIRGRIIAAEFKALSKAQGSSELIRRAAANYARQKIDDAKVRDLRPSVYTRAEARAAKAAEKAFIKGDINKAAAEKRNQLVQNTLAREALKVREEMNKARKYLAKFDKVVKSIPIEYREQIETLLEDVELSNAPSLKELDRRTSLVQFVREQEADGNPISIDPDYIYQISRKNYRDMTVSEMRGLVDTVKNLEHIGRLKNKLLTARRQKDYQSARDEIVATIIENANGRESRKRTAATKQEKIYDAVNGFFWGHAKISSIARIMDGGKDGGAVWEYLIRPLNEAGDKESVMMADATEKLTEIMQPLIAGANQTKTNYIGLGKLTKQQLYALALNMGNAGNIQRVLDGNNWHQDAVMGALQNLSTAEWQAIQQVWDFVESYRPQIAALERRTVGVEPEWVEAQPFTVLTADGETITLKGGYYPAKYDREASFDGNRNELKANASDIMNAAQMAAHTRHSFTKDRAKAVKNRPVLLDLSVLYNGVNEIIHDLSHREAIMDVNKFLKSRTIDEAIITHYGRTVKNQLDSAIQDIAKGNSGLVQEMDKISGWVRQGVSAAGLGFNVMNTLMQFTGIFPAISRIGYKYAAEGITQYMRGGATKGAMEISDFMDNRGRTRFRELNEVANSINGQSKVRKFFNQHAYFFMLKTQQVVDTVVWHGALKKAHDGGFDAKTAISLADQAVLDTQGGGQTKDLSAMERGRQTAKLFTVFYSYMNAMYNLSLVSVNTKQPAMKKAADLMHVLVIPTLLNALMKSMLTPGDDDEALADKLAKEQISFMLGLFVGVRELSSLASLWGDSPVYDYQGTGGLRLFADTIKFGQQAKQGEVDDAFIKASINIVGSMFGIPSAQINRTLKGYRALDDDDTDNPAALLFGYEE